MCGFNVEIKPAEAHVRCLIEQGEAHVLVGLLLLNLLLLLLGSGTTTTAGSGGSGSGGGSGSCVRRDKGSE